MLITDPIDFLLGPDGDLDTSTGALVASTSVAAVAQQIDIVLSMARGEWIYNTAAGTPYDEILGQPYDQTKALAVFRAAILSVAGVGSLDTLTVAYDGPLRTLTVTWAVTCTFGDTAAGSTTLGV